MFFVILIMRKYKNHGRKKYKNRQAKTIATEKT